MSTSQRTIVIGDLHGCFDEAVDLLDKVAATSADRVIFAGDLVDRGPKRRECVELAMRHECILGNHEDRHLKIRRQQRTDVIPDHAETLRVEQMVKATAYRVIVVDDEHAPATRPHARTRA